MNGLHEACYVAPDNATWRIFTQLQPAALVNVSRALPHSHTVFRIIMGAIEPPEDGDWTQGLALAHTLQQEGFFPTMSRVTAAQWAQRNLVSLRALVPGVGELPVPRRVSEELLGRPRGVLRLQHCVRVVHPCYAACITVW
jgi:hypothetical protein